MIYFEIFIAVFVGSALTGLAMRISSLRISVDIETKILNQRVEALQKRFDAHDRKSTLPKNDPIKNFLTL